MDHSLLACSLISSMACVQTPQLVQPPQLWQEQPQGWPQGLQLWRTAHHGSFDSAGNSAKVPSNGRQHIAVPVAAQPPCGLMWVRTGACHSCWFASQTAVTLQHESKLTIQHLPAALTAKLVQTTPRSTCHYICILLQHRQADTCCLVRVQALKQALLVRELAQMLASKVARLGESIVWPDRSMQGMHDPP